MSSLVVRASGWYQFWHPGSAHEWHIDSESISWDGSAASRLPIADLIGDPHVEPGLIWHYVVVPAKLGEHRSPGLREADARAAVRAIEARRKTQAAQLAAGVHGEVQALLAEWDASARERRWVRASWASSWRTRAGTLSSRLPSTEMMSLLDDKLQRDLLRFRDLEADTERHRAAANAAHEAWALSEFRQFFDTVESSPLTHEQRLACIRDEDSNLVLASAGSGKTSVITARAGYLVASGQARPEDILVLAFNADAAKEIRDRLKSRAEGLDRVDVRTFHAFGQSVLKHGRSKPSISRLAEQDAELPLFVLEQLRRLAGVAGRAGSPGGDPDLRDVLTRHLAAPEAMPADPTDLSRSALTSVGTPLEGATRRTALRGKKHATADARFHVKSQAELTIANFLFMNQVDYSYEAPYEHATADVDRRQYKPDFYLPEYAIYLEHFAITDKAQRAPEGWDAEAYLAKVAWARDLHAGWGTRLIETSSADAQGADGLAGELERRLVAAGVKLRPRPLQPLFADVDLYESRDPRVVLVRLVARFITTAKTSLLTDEDLLLAAKKQGPRSQAVVRLALKVRDAYEAELAAAGEIDFTDMIIGATGRIMSREVPSGYTHVLVDEFQDLSAARASLLMALRDARTGCSLFCVGDDWQSIYAFTGSDVSWITDFGSRFGPHATTALDRTFRFDQRQADLSRDFVTQNPSQVTKPVRALRQGTADSVRVVYTDEVGLATRSAIETRTLALIAREAASSERRGTALVLTRYSPSQDDRATVDALRRAVPELRWEVSTVHRAKGREADHVFVVGLSNGLLGFPNLLEDDPVLRLVLPAGEPFPNAEERRLFYVALTRARRQVWLLAPRSNPSVFVSELMDRHRDIPTLAVRDGMLAIEVNRPQRCPRCTVGTIVTRTGPFGAFLGCSAWPTCEARFVVCPKCQDHPFLPDPTVRGRFACSGAECSYGARSCPDCSRMDLPKWTGFLVRREGRYGPFLGCRNWRPEGGCKHTERTN